jgi:hypothetical protein
MPPRRRQAFALVAGSLRYLAERDNQVGQRPATEGVRFLNALTRTGRCPGPIRRHVTRNAALADKGLAAGAHGNPGFPPILDSFAPARHKFGHWRGRFGPRELLRR